MADGKYKAPLALDAVPDESLPTEEWVQQFKIYRAVQNLARYVDQGIGVNDFDLARGQAGNQAPAATVGVGRLKRLVLRFHEDVPAGNVVTFGRSDTLDEVVAMKAQPNSTFTSTHSFRKFPKGFVVKDVTAGDFGEIYMEGVLRISGLSPGQMYYASSANPGLITTGSELGNNNDYIGQALTDDTLYFNPPQRISLT